MKVLTDTTIKTEENFKKNRIIVNVFHCMQIIIQFGWDSRTGAPSLLFIVRGK